jgi:transcriptional regulator with XRE-family HTH domain
MFNNIPLTLSLLRELRKKSQAGLAKDAKIGKSQLSKYETGRELPKFDSLEKVLNALEISYPEFFYALHLVDRLSAGVLNDRSAGASKNQPLSMLSLAEGPSLLGENTRQAFSQVFSDLLLLHHRMIEQMVLSSGSPQASRPRSATRKRKSSHRAAASSPPRSASPR